MKTRDFALRAGLAVALCMAQGAEAKTKAPAAPKATPKVAPQAPSINARDVNYGPAPAWIAPAPAPTATPDKPGAPYRVEYSDTQVRAVDGGTETYSNYRIRILKPDALALGNLTLAWQPDGGSATVHAVRIVRDGKPIDVLETTKFRVMEREQNLDQATLDGLLSAVLHVPGLQVGDTLEFSASVVAHDQTLGKAAFGLGGLPSEGQNGAFRYRLIWPEGQTLAYKTTKDLQATVGHAPGGMNEIVYELRDPAGAVPTDGAPIRYQLRRVIEFTGFESWDDLSRQMYPLFETAATLKPGSPIQAEIDRIKAQSADPVVRMQLALSLVEDRIRYVFVGLDGGNYRPTAIDETWQRKYGDCKGKTVLLLAILRGLDIPAEAVLANTSGGDGINEWLASPVLFNHVLVRATVGGKAYWLDGTRVGDKRLDQIPPPAFRWVLPVRAAGAPIEAVKPEPLTEPLLIQNVDIDASAGFDAPAKVTLHDMFRGDQGRAMQRQLEALSPEDATQALKSYGNNSGAWNELQTASWQFDDDRNVLTITLKGTWRLDWDGTAAEGRSFTIPGAGFYPPDERHRAAEQDQSAPWLKESFPKYQCWTTTIHLPEARKGWGWGYRARPMNARLGGQAYWRDSGLTGNVMRTVMSSNVFVPEITAAEAEAVNSVVPAFDNKQSSVYEARGSDKASAPLPFGEAQAWPDLVKTCAPH